MTELPEGFILSKHEDIAMAYHTTVNSRQGPDSSVEFCPGEQQLRCLGVDEW